MATPVFGPEGVRLSCTQTKAAFIARATGGSSMIARVWADSNRKRLIAQSDAVTLTAPTYYFGYCEVSGLLPGRRYWYDIYADDGAGNSAVTSGVHEAGSFKTIPSDGHTPVRLAIMGCNPIAPNYSPAKSEYIHQIAASIRQQKVDFCFSPGDNVYRDLYANAGSGYLVNGTWINANTTPDWSVDALLTNYVTSYGFLAAEGLPPDFAAFYANTPTLWIPDDHDRAYNDCDDRVNDTSNASKWASGLIATQRFCVNLNKQTIEQNGGTYTPETTQEMYCYQDIGDVRVVFTDARTFRTNRDAADGPDKSILGPVQKAWWKAAISANPKKFLLWISPGMLDGLHDWTDPDDIDDWLDTGTTSISAILDSYPNFRTEQQELIDFLFSAANPVGIERTAVLCSDTHFAGVSRFTRNGKYLYEVDAGNGFWVDGGHEFLNYYPDGEMICAIQHATCFAVVDIRGGVMRIKLLLTDRSREIKDRIVWQRAYT